MQAMLKLFLTFIGCFFTTLSFAQTHIEVVEYDKLLNYKVNENRFEFGWLPNAYGKIPCFRDYTKTEIHTQLVDKKKDSVFYTSTEPERNGLKIIPDKIALDRENRIFNISGQISGAWEWVTPSEFEIFVGHRTDTVSDITVSPNLHGDIYFNGTKVEKTIVIATVPAFYLTNFKKFEAYIGDKKMANSDYKEILFDISVAVDQKSVLVFGLSSRYAEIFEIGKLLSNQQ
ncbi:hypothetical protein L3C95_18230 [Chitinophaga filiformis]|uniref:hypothetical protein n=1 Tax=Chitinophaga filiformis TaxID=104663 RepID=UPI001F1FF570|nr:hypothetical protein [Chitinophaga filiformis]MCF6404843.1 hypothetical protein [Chitinophaga filiformis]